MKQHLNTLFVTMQGAYLRKDGQAVDVRVDKQTCLRVPLHNLGGIVCFGRVLCSPALMAACAQASVAVSFLTESGRLLARVVGFGAGNVLLRREQYRQADSEAQSLAIARSILTAKIANTRSVLLRAARDHAQTGHVHKLRQVASRMSQTLDRAQQAASLEQIRGLEGEAAHDYFGVFDNLIVAEQTGDRPFRFTKRTRRPPLDRVNCLLSFLYSILGHDTRSACEVVGLDPQVGFLHRDRPGRPGLALDLMEEFRAYLTDRVTLSLINRKQVRPDGFKITDSGGVSMTDDTRKAVLTAYQKRKQETVTHPFLGEKTTVGLLVHLQARLLARYLRGELDAYPAFFWK